MQKNSLVLALIVILGAAVVGLGVYFVTKDEVPTVTTTTITNSTVTKTDLAATIAYQQGDVQVKKDGSDWQTVETDTVLHQGDSVKTGENSKAIIELENGDIVRLGYSTDVLLTGLKSNAVTVSQTTGATYNRLVKNISRTYQVKVDEVTVQALGTAFDVMESDETIDVNVVENTVKVVTDDEQKQVDEGKSVTVDKDSNDVNVNDIDENDLTNDWYTWNKEEDSKTTRDLGVLEDYAGPTLTITTPEDNLTTSLGTVTVTGTVSDFDAKLTVNDEEVENSAGQFSHELTLSAGKNVITVIAEDADGHRTIKEVRVHYQVAASATPISLTASTESDGVHLSWNESTGATFVYYKVVRSESNADLKYPDDGYIAKKDKGQLSHIDTDASAEKTYYYRVCEVMTGEGIFCSNVVHMTGKTVEQPEPPVDTPPEPTEPITSSGITLTATAESDGVHLSWTVTDLTIEHGFKVIKGASANPVFPGNDYYYASDSSARSYTWPLTDGQAYHFRVCQYNSDGKCLVYSNDVEVTAYQLTETDVGLIMSAKAETTGVGLWWTNVSETVDGFNYYKVVRSEDNPNLRYPDDSYIAVKSAGQENHRDYSAISGTSYYYRICAVGDNTYCSNVVQVTATHDNAAPSAVTLTGAYSSGSVLLSWTQSGENDFRYYKVVWSNTNSSPAYPTDGYIKKEPTVHSTSFTDDGSKIGTRTAAVDLTTGTHYYSICVVDSANQVTCGNTVTLTNGVVQQLIETSLNKKRRSKDRSPFWIVRFLEIVYVNIEFCRLINRRFGWRKFAKYSPLDCGLKSVRTGVNPVVYFIHDYWLFRQFIN